MIKATFAASVLAGVLLSAGSSAAQPTPVLHYDFNEAAAGAQPALDLGMGLPADGIFVNDATRTGNTPSSASVAALDVSARQTSVTTPPPNFLSAGNAAKVDNLSTFTFSLWINLQDAAWANIDNGDRLLSKRKEDELIFYDWFLTAADDGTPFRDGDDLTFRTQIMVRRENNQARSVSSENISARVNEWLFLAVTRDSLGNGVLYIGGAAAEDSVSIIGAGTLGTGGAIGSNTASFVIGGIDTRGTDGVLLERTPPAFFDDVRVYTAALSQEEIELVRLANLGQPAAPLPGDANGDGRVDGEDFLIWQAAFGTQSGATWGMGDFNGDGRVDGEDFLIWQAHFGTVAAATAAVPEPAALALLPILLMAAAGRRRRT